MKSFREFLDESMKGYEVSDVMHTFIRLEKIHSIGFKPIDPKPNDSYPIIGKFVSGSIKYFVEISKIENNKASVLLFVDIDTSNYIIRNNSVSLAEKVNQFAKELVDKLSPYMKATIVPFSGSSSFKSITPPKINLEIEIQKTQSSTTTNHSPSPAKYDPYQSFLDRRTPTAVVRDARIARQQFASDFGGSSSNYRY